MLCSFSSQPGVIRTAVSSRRPLTADDRTELRTLVRRCFRLDEDFSPFHRMAANAPTYKWIAKRRVGRLLRAPTVFEDLVKMICTTNCSWALTTAMVTKLCASLGDRFDTHRFAFPTPRVLADSSESFLRNTVRAGYRAPYLLSLARSIDNGTLDPERWLDKNIPAEELYHQLQSVRGVGEYAAGNILKLLGRYDYLGLDSWVRGQYSRLHHGGRRVSDATIARRYKEFGCWRGLLFWLEMTKHWYEEKFPLLP